MASEEENDDNFQGECIVLVGQKSAWKNVGLSAQEEPWSCSRAAMPRSVLRPSPVVYCLPIMPIGHLSHY